ncbi:recombinase family protein [Streptomyces sp. NPDC056628]|uniref:recombinase family protein n=1 Tax=Streptomyces sp. NPDC056628 TaxID=3345882 RepID=UPI00369131B5
MLITMAVRKAGAQFVSSKENIDETPSGRLLHGIMASIAEFYSANLATESKKGMRQKAKSGGTPGHASLGYLNVRERIDGREIRTVIVDEQRAPHIQWMFSAYATGDWTMRQLEEELDRRGLRIPATKKLPERKVSYQHIDKMLTNRYYTGIVRYEGIWYEGRHPAIVDQATFDRVQAIRTTRAQAREEVRKHPHYLKGSIFCGRCDARFGVMNATNRWGTVYPYFYCLGRAKDRTSCTQSTVLISDVEASVAEYWKRVQLSPERIAAIREQVMTALVQHQKAGQAEVKRQEQRRQDLRNAQLKLIEMRYADAIPLDLLKSEQERITRELAAAQEIIDRYSTEMDSVLSVVEGALLLCSNAYRLYFSAPPTVRRQLNQAVFARFLILDDQVQGADLTSGFAQLLASDLTAPPQNGPHGDERTGVDVRQPRAIKPVGRHRAPIRHPAHRRAEPRSEPGPGFR